MFKYTQNEYVEAEKQLMIVNKTMCKYDLPLAVLFVFISMGNLFLSSFSRFSTVMFLVVLAFAAIEIFRHFFWLPLKFKRTPEYHEESTIVFSADSIEWKTPGIDAEIEWGVYSELWESDDFYFLIETSRKHVPIPKRAFANLEERRAFEELARSNLRSAKRV